MLKAMVVICFRISIFEPLKTTTDVAYNMVYCCDLLSN